MDPLLGKNASRASGARDERHSKLKYELCYRVASCIIPGLVRGCIGTTALKSLPWLNCGIQSMLLLSTYSWALPRKRELYSS